MTDEASAYQSYCALQEQASTTDIGLEMDNDRQGHLTGAELEMIQGLVRDHLQNPLEYRRFQLWDYTDSEGRWRGPVEGSVLREVAQMGYMPREARGHLGREGSVWGGHDMGSCRVPAYFLPVTAANIVTEG